MPARRQRRFSYSRWDGSQTGFDLDADSVFDEITDDLLYHGDLNAALRRLLQQGFKDRDGRDVQGLRDVLEGLRRRRRDELERHDLGGVYDEIAEALREVVETERRAIDAATAAARASGDERRRETAEAAGAERHASLSLLPDDLAGRMKALEHHDFQSAEARERFEELVARLRQHLMQQHVDQMSGAVAGTTPEAMAAMKDMLAELNHMLEQRARGDEPDFDGFMSRHGQFFPENPQTLDELLEVMARRMGAAQAMLNSMTPAQRDQMRQLSEQLLEDMDLRWHVDQLQGHLRSSFPQAGWERRYNFSGADPLDLAEAADVMERLADLDRLEQLLRSATNPGALAEVDVDRARDLLGDETAESLERMAEIARLLEEQGYVEQREGRLELTPRGMRKIGSNALADLYRKLAHDRPGDHRLDRVGAGHERAYETKPYEFGDPFNLSIERTVRNALRRTGGGTPVRLEPADFEIERTEQQTRTASVLMLDLSLSMPMRDNFLPAKKVTMALHSLISSQYPRDYLGIVGFSSVARVLAPHDLPEVSWDYVYGTNMQHGLLLSRQLLARQSGTKQIIMITDGEPTAHFEAGMAEPFFHYPPVRETVDATLREVNRCTREGIHINTFMLDVTSYLREFIEKLTTLNGGRAFYTTNEDLGDYVLHDFIEHRRAHRSSRR